MRKEKFTARSLASAQALARRKNAAAQAISFVLSLMLILPSLLFSPSLLAHATTAKKPQRQRREAPPPAPPVDNASKPSSGVYYPESAPVKNFPPIHFDFTAQQEALAPESATPGEIKSIDPPKGRPDWFENRGRTPAKEGEATLEISDEPAPQPPAPSAQGSSPAPFKTFPGEFLTGGSIPPDTMGAVGPNHVMTVSNDRINIRTRNGVLISRMTLDAFWAGVVLEGGITTPATFDPKIFYDRSADRWFFFTSANSVSPASSVLFAATMTNDPTGMWFRSVFDADPNATGGATGTGRWADYPTVGHTQDWIVANYNVFNYSGTATTGYYGPYIYVIPKSLAYAGTLTLGQVSLFQESTAACVSPFNNFLGCGFTMAPSVNENNTAISYLVEDWDSVFGQLRVSKITGPANAPVLTVGTQFPQSTENWRFNAARIGTSGGYVPQRDNVAYAVSAPTGSRIMANDARINNAVLRNGRLWASHHAMVGAAPNTPGTPYGVANPDIKTAVQWWQIDPTIEAQPDPVTGLGTAPTQRGRIVDPLADNCNSANSINNSTERAGCTIQGQFFFFAGIAVNKDNDMLVGFTQSSPLTYPSAAYAIRRASDPANTTRDVVVFRSGASNYNIGAGTGTTRQNRWGDYSASMTDPVNDTDFWTNQEFSETRTALAGLGGAIAAPWATWWAQVKPNSTQPTTTGNLIISEFRLRGPGGINDEFVELYNPSTTTPFRVQSVDNSEGWALASNNGTTTSPKTVIPQGVVVPPRGHYLIANSPNSTTAGAETFYYSLRNYPGASTLDGGSPTGAVGGIRTTTADTGYSPCTTAGCASTTDAIGDTHGIAIFKSTNSATGFIAANVSDAAGPNTLPGGTLFREGAGYAPLPTTNLEYTMFRNLSAGPPQDTNNNAADFIFADTSGAMTTAGQQLGAPGPENLDSPIQRNSEFPFAFLDATVAGSALPNRTRNLTSDPVNNSTFGTLEIRRRVVNNTGGPVTRLRFRIVDLTTFPPPNMLLADLRARTSMTVMVSGINDAATCLASTGSAMTPCTVTLEGTTVETPPMQPNGGGLDSTYSIALPATLAAGASVNVNFLLGVQQTGRFRFYVNVEALP